MKSFFKEKEKEEEGTSLEFEFKSEQLKISPQEQPGWTFTSPKPQTVWLLQSVIYNIVMYDMFVGEQSFS